jgi:hypothetical protein
MFSNLTAPPAAAGKFSAVVAQIAYRFAVGLSCPTIGHHRGSEAFLGFWENKAVG